MICELYKKLLQSPYRGKFVRRILDRAKLFVRRNFHHQTINSSPWPDEKYRPVKLIVSSQIYTTAMIKGLHQ